MRVAQALPGPQLLCLVMSSAVQDVPQDPVPVV